MIYEQIVITSGRSLHLPRRGWRAGAPVACRPEGGVGDAPWFPTPLPWGVARGPRPSPPPSLAHLSWVYMFSRGCRAAPSAGRGLAGRRWVSLAGGGGAASAPYPRGPVRVAPRGGGRGGLFAAVCSPAFSGRAPRRVASSVPRPPCCITGCRRSAAAHWAPLSAGAELPLSSRHCGSEWAAHWGHSVRGCARRGVGVPPLGAAALSGGMRGRRLPGRPPAIRGPGGGGGGGGSPQSPPGPPAPPPGGPGGWPGGSGPRGPAADGGSHSSPAPLHPLGARPSCRPSPGSPAVLAAAACCRLAVRGGWGSKAGECWGRRFGSALSCQRAVRQWASPRARCPRPLPYWRCCAPFCRVVRSGGWGSRSVRGARPCWGGGPAALSPPPPSRSSPGAGGRGRHLRRRLRGGWGCGGGWFCRR